MDPGAEVVGIDEHGALLLVPLVHPGIRDRLLWIDDAWCTRAAFNAGASGDALDDASRFARIAAAPFFDGVDVTGAREVQPGRVALTTHARTNGVVADWLVAVDAQGVREATWTATRFAVAPFEAQLEGFTALPGATRTYARAPDGLVEMTTPLVPTPRVAPVSLATLDTFSDGFRIQFHHGETSVYPSLGIEPLPLDVVRHATGENYREFLAWGLRKGWSSNTGRVWVDDDTSASCLACVFIAQDFNIHISSGVVGALAALGYTYPDSRAAMSSIIGHEMFHNFQNAYSKPNGGATFMGGAYSEGLARFQESLHDYAAVSHQDDSLLYAADANGCNDELGVQSGSPVLFDGPATSQSYSACDLWLTFYGRHGVDGVVSVLEASFAHRTKTGWDEVKSVVEGATGSPIDDDLAGFAAAILSGEGLAWGPVVGSGPTLDWARFLDGWVVPDFALGGAYTRTLRDGGMMAARLDAPGTIASSSAAARLYLVHDDGSFEPVASGVSVTQPAWIVAILPGTGSGSVTLSYA